MFDAHRPYQNSLCSSVRKTFLPHQLLEGIKGADDVV
jgi:hypothetical protein